MFVNFLNNGYDAIVLEDIDYDLNSRKEGNTFMYKLLNSSDGIISSNNKKIILSTNLPSVKDVDEALLRPGRCFDVLKTRNLTRNESEDFLKNFNSSIDLSKDNYSLAELYRLINNRSENRLLDDNREKIKIGFKL